MPFARSHFDGVFSNTILHHVSDPVAFFREAWRVRKDDGAFVIRDLMRPDSVADAEKLVAKHAAGSNEYQQKLFYDSLLAAYTIDEVLGLLEQAEVKGATVEASSDRHLTIWVARR